MPCVPVLPRTVPGHVHGRPPAPPPLLLRLSSGPVTPRAEGRLLRLPRFRVPAKGPEAPEEAVRLLRGRSPRSYSAQDVPARVAERSGHATLCRFCRPHTPPRPPRGRGHHTDPTRTSADTWAQTRGRFLSVSPQGACGPEVLAGQPPRSRVSLSHSQGEWFTVAGLRQSAASAAPFPDDRVYLLFFFALLLLSRK